MHHWYVINLFETRAQEKNRFKGALPFSILDSELLNIICEITGLTELEVINKAVKEIQTYQPNFFWSFDNYFINFKCQLHPLVRHHLRLAFLELQVKLANSATERELLDG